MIASSGRVDGRGHVSTIAILGVRRWAAAVARANQRRLGLALNIAWMNSRTRSAITDCKQQSEY